MSEWSREAERLRSYNRVEAELAKNKAWDVVRGDRYWSGARARAACEQDAERGNAEAAALIEAYKTELVTQQLLK